MKKLLLVLVMMTIMTMALSSEELSPEIKKRLNDYIITFDMQKITYNGVEGYFIPSSGFTKVELCLRKLLMYEDLVIIKDDRIQKLEKYELEMWKWKTGLGVSVAFNVGLTCIAAGIGMILYKQ
jgi:hypothetical protein